MKHTSSVWVVKYGRLAPEKSGMPLKPCWLMNSCGAAQQTRSATRDTLAHTPGTSGLQLGPHCVRMPERRSSVSPVMMSGLGADAPALHARLGRPVRRVDFADSWSDEARLQTAAEGLDQGVAVQHDAGADLQVRVQ